MISLHVNKKLYGVIDDMSLHVNIDIKNKTFLAISGDSGAGKTTLLRIIAGLENSESEIVVDDEIWQNKDIFLPPQKRKIGFVFQHFALFPNMSVLKNLLYIKNDKKKANRLLEICNLLELKNRYPQTLSGGQKQRVGLCRAMMGNPKILLLDEPFSALDKTMRERLQNEILKLHNEFEITTIMVSHEPSEIYKLANEMVVLKNGKIIHQDEPKKVLLKSKYGQKFSFFAKILDIKKVDVMYVAILSIGQQIVEVIISRDEAKELKIGDEVNVSTKAFTPMISSL